MSQVGAPSTQNNDTDRIITLMLAGRIEVDRPMPSRLRWVGHRYLMVTCTNRKETIIISLSRLQE